MIRIDDYLCKFGYCTSRTKAKQFIERGEVILNGKRVERSSTKIDSSKEHNIQILAPKKFVSLGGFKLDKALNDFNFDVRDFICADIGSSTGGFTDCLLQNNAKKVYAVDLNDTLLDESLKNSDRVVEVVSNARLLTKDFFNENLDLITADLSFISAKMVMPIFSNLLDDGGFLLLLIKPQFEIDKKVKFKSGIIKDKHIQKDVCQKIYDCAINHSLIPLKLTTAPICKDKNLEYLMLLKKSNESPIPFDILHKF